MTPEMVMDLAHQGMKVAVVLSAPALIAALLIGLVVSLFQAATQVNEMTLSFIPKIIGVIVVLSIAGPFLIQEIMEFSTQIFRNIPSMASV